MYKFMCEVSSDSNPTKCYQIKMKDDGQLTCNCPSWIFNVRRNRTCKHIDRLRAAGFQVDGVGKILISVTSWGYKSPIVCKTYPKCVDCGIRFACYTSRELPESLVDYIG